MASSIRSICEVARRHGPVLVDTNVILESRRVGSWRALTGGYRVETVEDCVTETQTAKEIAAEIADVIRNSAAPET